MQDLGINCSITKEIDKLQLLTHESELNIIKKIGSYEEEIAYAAKERMPHKIAHYVYELASLFHTFYNQCRIVGVESDLQQARISLISATKVTLIHALGILGVTAPERM